MRSILSKFLLVVISGLVILSLVISAIAFTTTNSLLRQDANVILTNLCQKEAAAMNDILGDIEKSVQIMAFNVMADLEALPSTPAPEQLQQCADELIPHFFNIAANTNGAVAFYLRFNPEISTPTSGIFASMENGSSTLTLLPPTDLSLYSPDDTEHVGWYYQPVAAGVPLWMQPYYNRNTDLQLISYIIPLYMKDALLGIVGMDVDFSMLIDAVNSISVYDEGRAYLIGTHQESYNRPLHQEAGTSRHTAAFAHADTPLLNGMTLHTCVSYDVIHRDSYSILNKILVAFLSVLFVFILFTLIITRQIVKPLQKLTKAATQISQGNMDVDLSCRSKDEIGTLSRVFRQTMDILKKNLNAMNALAYRDAMTGVKNQTAFSEAIQRMDSRTGDPPSPYAVLVADLNYLKETNDKYGHDFGNELIIKSSEVLCRTFKRSPVFRIGGDEFVVILENHDLEHAQDLIAQMDRSTAETLLDTGFKSLPLSIARGISHFIPGQDTCFHDVFQRADHAMYQHKQQIKGNMA